MKYMALLWLTVGQSSNIEIEFFHSKIFNGEKSPHFLRDTPVLLKNNQIEHNN